MEKRIEELKNINMSQKTGYTFKPKDLLAFALWIDDKMYHHRLKIKVFQTDMVLFYIQNRDSILKQYGYESDPVEEVKTTKGVKDM